jgi:sporulation protein YlmC with PRC-barrel domain
MKHRHLLTLSLAATLATAGLHAQQGSSELQQQKQQLEQQEKQLERRMREAGSEGREELQEQKRDLQNRKRDLEQKLKRQGQQASTSSSQSSSSEASKDELKVDESEAKKEVTDVNKASKLIGMKVMNRENENIGKIKDMAVDLSSGKIAYVVLSAGGTLGVGGKLIAVPVESLTPLEGQEGFLIDAEKDRLSQAPGFTEKDWPKIDAAENSTVGLSPTGRTSEKKSEQK